MSKPEYRVGDKLFLSSSDTVIPVTVLDVHTTKNPVNTTYTVFHEGLVPFEKEVLAKDLHDTLLRALQIALIINDDEARDTCRLITESSDKLQRLHAANARMRQLLYEQQIMEYMKNKQHNKNIDK